MQKKKFEEYWFAISLSIGIAGIFGYPFNITLFTSIFVVISGIYGLKKGYQRGITLIIFGVIMFLTFMFYKMYLSK